MCPPKRPCEPDIRALTLLRPAEEQMDLTPNLPEIHPVTGSKIQPQLRDAFANRFHIAEKPILKAIDADAYSSSGLNVESIQPFGERFSSGFVLTNKNLSWCGFQMRSRAMPRM
jgi:hypothetical protein